MSSKTGSPKASARQAAIDGVMAEGFAVIGKVSQYVVDLADQQILAVGSACHRCFHADKFTNFGFN